MGIYHWVKHGTIYVPALYWTIKLWKTWNLFIGFMALLIFTKYNVVGKNILCSLTINDDDDNDEDWTHKRKQNPARMLIDQLLP